MNPTSKRTSLGEFSAILIVTGFLAAPLQASVALAPLFVDGAVIQRDKPVPVWGTADAGEKISVVFAGQNHATTADAGGRWRVNLAALPASSTPREIVIKASNIITVRDVLVGEVWLASGQSNMEWPLAYSTDAKKEIAAANFPLVRQFKVAKQPGFTPLATVAGTWTPALPDTAGQFSGVAYYFALDLHRKLKVPVGILNSSWGGTGIDTWISPDACRTAPSLASAFQKFETGPRATAEEKAAFQESQAAWEKARDDAKAAKQPFSQPAPKAPPGLPSSRTLTALYNGMIHPLVPYALRGAIWYQGESSTSIAAAYPGRMEALVGGWRQAFDQGDFPFYWVQLPNLDIGGQNQTNWLWAEMREAQAKSLSIPNTAQAVTLDVGDNKGLHPKNKKPVGERLALLALARTYSMKDVVDSGPAFKSATLEGSAYRITYQPSPSALTPSPAGLTGFELAGRDQVFHPAEAVIDGSTVVVTSLLVKDPVALRYAYRNAPAVGLFNADGLPAAPFRTDSWPAPKETKTALPASAP
jgi:sialate O-acetylesterase